MSGPLGRLVRVALCGLLGQACSDVPRPSDERVYGVQLHLHGSMSEGAGSMRGHNAAASALGGSVDVLWWTDHDWRLQAYTHVDGFDFEDSLVVKRPVPAPLRSDEVVATALEEGVEWVSSGWQRPAVARPLRELSLRFAREEARRGRSSLRIQARAGPGEDWERLLLSFAASRRRQTASLASDLRIGLSLLPERIEGDARLVVSLLLSQQPEGFQGRIDYRLSPRGRAAGDEPAAGGEVAVERSRRVDPRLARPLEVVALDLPWRPGIWNDLVLEPARDAERHGLGGADNSLVDLSLVVEARAGGRVSTYVDALKIERRRVGEALFEEEKRMADEIGQRGIVNHVGQEISYAAHLNAYGADVPLVDPRDHPRGLTPAEAVAHAHGHGGIVSLNHAFGVSEDTRPFNAAHYEARVEELVAVRAWEADLLEVGYRRRGFGLRIFLDLWDRLSAAGIFVTGVGVSDSHDNEVGWQRGPNNFITWVYSRSASQDDLMRGLRAGRAFFGDPTRFDGLLDIETEAGARMGQVVAAAAAGERVRYRATGLREDQTLCVVRDGRPGPTLAPHDGALEWSEQISVTQPTFVRIEVLEEGQAVALSNPLYLQPAALDRRVPEARRP